MSAVQWAVIGLNVAAFIAMMTAFAIGPKGVAR